MTASPTILLSISGERKISVACRAKLRRAVKAALGAHEVTAARIGLRLVSDDEMADLNERHLGHPGPTDVLTFDVGDEAGLLIDGEIALSVDTARREAKRLGHDRDVELALYAVHGVLHLLGYRDDARSRAAKMHRKEDEILESLGWGKVFATQ